MPNETVPRGHCNRCDRCGWTFSETTEGGCTPGNCSMRYGLQNNAVPLRDTCVECGKRYEDAAPVTAPVTLATLCDELERHDREMTAAPWDVDDDNIGTVAARLRDGTTREAYLYRPVGCVSDQQERLDSYGTVYLRNNAARIASELRRLMRVEATARAAEEDRECRGKSTVTGDRWDRIIAALRGDK